MGIEQLSPEQQKLVSKFLKMLGKDGNDSDKISLGKNGGIILEKGKLNVERFLQKVMEY